jgi:hypothetical protein
MSQQSDNRASFIRVLMLQRMLCENETAYIDGLKHALDGQYCPSQISLGGFTHVASLDGSAEADQPYRTLGVDGREQANDESALEPRLQVNAARPQFLHCDGMRSSVPSTLPLARFILEWPPSKEFFRST